MRLARRKPSAQAAPQVRKAGGPVEVFENPHPKRDYEIDISCPEFTSVCPKTGNPDFGEIRVTYVPDRLCIELKSFKLYLFGYRDRGVFYEKAVNDILDDLVASCRPRRMTVVGSFNARGGMKSVITARHGEPGDGA